VLAFVLDYCQGRASAASCEVKRCISEQFGIAVSVSQRNRVRAAYGLSRWTIPREKKPKTGIFIASGSHEQAQGACSRLSAATETGLLTQKAYSLRDQRSGRVLAQSQTSAILSKGKM
jgi:hypothetical protein